jgi:hypothetical protein
MDRSAHKLGIEEGERKDHANRSFASSLTSRDAATIDPACEDLLKPKLSCGDGSKQMQMQKLVWAKTLKRSRDVDRDDRVATPLMRLRHHSRTRALSTKQPTSAIVVNRGG